MFEEDDEFIKISNQPVKISDAAQPEDVYWFNLKVSGDRRRKYIIYSWVVLTMVLILTFAALLGIRYWKQGMDNVDFNKGIKNQVGTILLTILMGTITTAINKTLFQIMRQLSFMEKHKNKIQRLQSLLSKTVVAQGLNTVFIHGIIYLINPSNEILGANGLIPQVNSVIVVGSIAAVLKEAINPKFQYYRFKNWKTDKSEPVDTFQIRLN
jgi:hypothetical protein